MCVCVCLLLTVAYDHKIVLTDLHGEWGMVVVLLGWGFFLGGGVLGVV